MAAKSHRALKITGIVIGVIVGIALIAVVALNIYMRVAFAPFFDRAESPFDIPGINTGFVPQDLDHVEADDSWLFSGYMADHSPSPLYRRTADGTITKFYVSLPDGSPYDGHGSAITTNEQYAYLACEEGYLVIPMDDLLFAEDGASVQATEKVDVDLSPAFMNIEQGQLLLGNFYYPNDYEDAGEPPHHHAGRHREPRGHVRLRRRSCRAGPFPHRARQRVLHSRHGPGHLYHRRRTHRAVGLLWHRALAPARLQREPRRARRHLHHRLRRRGGAVLPRFPQPDGRSGRTAHARGHRIP